MRDAKEWEKCFQTGAVKAGMRAGRLCGRRCFVAGYLMKNKEMIVEMGGAFFEKMQLRWSSGLRNVLWTYINR